MAYKPRDLEGQRFGKLLVVDRAITPKGKTQAHWNCRCDCGNIVIVNAGGLRPKVRSSCGCGQNYFRLRPYESLYNWLVSHNTRDGRTTVDLSYEEFLEIIRNDLCHYCGEKLKFAKYSIRTNGASINLDRVDSSKGYSTDNCVPCCWDCNTMKSNLSQEAFLKRVAKIQRYQEREK